MLALSAAIVAAYLLGSLSGSLLLGRLRGVDIRRAGSGNAGGTNALRTQGWRFALGVVAIDIGKGSLATWLGLQLAALAPLPFGTAAQGALCGFAAIVGHCWPVFFGFRGGKGAGTALGAIVVLAPVAAALAAGAWLLVLLATGYVGLATVVAVVALALFALLGSPLPAAAGVFAAFAVATALLIVFTHRGNLARLAHGTELRFDKARLLHRCARRWLSRMDALLLIVPALLLASAACAVEPDGGIAAAAALIRAHAARHRLVLLGELHGTNEVPQLAAALVRAWSVDAPVRLALEVHASERASLRRYLASDGAAAARARLARSPFWNAPTVAHDGRRNAALLGLIEQVRQLRAHGRDVDVVPIDNPRTLQTDSETRDRAMAGRLRAAFRRLDHGRLVALVGNVHAMKRRPDDAPAEMQRPMGSYLGDLDPYAVDIRAATGETWICRPQCGAVPVPALHASSGPDDGVVYDFDIVLPRFTIARMLGAPPGPGGH